MGYTVKDLKDLLPAMHDNKCIYLTIKDKNGNEIMMTSLTSIEINNLHVEFIGNTHE